MKLKEKLKNVVDDLTSLEVATFSGTLDMEDVEILENQNGDSNSNTNTNTNINSKEIFNVIKQSLKDSGELVGYTRFELDGDTINFVSNQTTQETVFLLEGHKSMVAAAQESRAGLARFIGNVAGFNVFGPDPEDS